MVGWTPDRPLSHILCIELIANFANVHSKHFRHQQTDVRNFPVLNRAGESRVRQFALPPRN